MRSGAPAVAYIIGTYPLLTTTFIDREIRMLRSWGVEIHIVSLRRLTNEVSPEQAALGATVTYTRPVRPLAFVGRHLHFILRKPGRYLMTLARLVSRKGQSPRQRLRTIGHFGLAVYVAGELDGGIGRIHAHFIDRSAIVAHVASELLDVPYSITAHASDIYVDPVLLDIKMEKAEFVATCTGYNRAYLADQVNGAAEKVEVLYHGLEIGNYEPMVGADSEVPTLIAVGQLKEKKGYRYLLDACRVLVDRGVAFHCEIIGEGPERDELERRIRELVLDRHITLLGALPHSAVIAAYRRADVFVLPCVIGRDGDRDGIPNVILEAMAMQLPVVSTKHSGIPEAVAHKKTGILAAPGDAEALAEALIAVLEDRDGAREMGVRGREVILERFDAEANVRKLYERFATAGE